MDSFRFFIEYTIDNKRHDFFLNLFEKIKEEKSIYQTNRDYNFLENTNWLAFLDTAAKEWFSNTFDYKSEEGKVYLKLWHLAVPKIRDEHPIFKVDGNWDIASTLDAIFNGDYSLEKIEVANKKGKLFYNPGGAPFGGTASLVQLIESFGNIVTYDEWHEGSHLSEEAGWDYERAKELVLIGKPLNKYLDFELKPQLKNKVIKKKNWWSIF